MQIFVVKCADHMRNDPFIIFIFVNDRNNHNCYIIDLHKIFESQSAHTHSSKHYAENNSKYIMKRQSKVLKV